MSKHEYGKLTTLSLALDNWLHFGQYNFTRNVDLCQEIFFKYEETTPSRNNYQNQSLKIFDDVDPNTYRIASFVYGFKMP